MSKSKQLIAKLLLGVLICIGTLGFLTTKALDKQRNAIVNPNTYTTPSTPHAWQSGGRLDLTVGVPIDIYNENKIATLEFSASYDSKMPTGLRIEPDDSGNWHLIGTPELAIEHFQFELIMHDDFRPNNPANFIFEGSVAKGTLFADVPQLSGFVGESLQSVHIPDTNGRFEWQDPTLFLPTTPQKADFWAHFYPKDSQNYNNRELLLTVQVGTGLDSSAFDGLKVGQEFVKTLPEAFVLASGSQLPDGLNFDSPTQISGTPTKAYETFEFELQYASSGSVLITTKVDKGDLYITSPQGLIGLQGDHTRNIKFEPVPQGEWAWYSNSEKLATLGTNSYRATFALQGSFRENYNPIEPRYIEVLVMRKLDEHAFDDLTVDKPFDLNLTPIGNWTISDGVLPDGIELDVANNTISGRPQHSATYSFVLRRASDSPMSFDDVFVQKGTLNIEYPSAKMTAYTNSSLDDIELPQNTLGTWTWDDPTQSLSDKEETIDDYIATFSPNPSLQQDYRNSNFYVSITTIRGIYDNDFDLQVGQPFNFALPKGAWALSKDLPNGLQLNNGSLQSRIIGTPTTAGQFDFELFTQDHSQSYSIAGQVKKGIPQVRPPQNIQGIAGAKLSEINIVSVAGGMQGQWEWDWDALDTQTTLGFKVGSKQEFAAIFRPDSVDYQEFATVLSVEIISRITEPEPSTPDNNDKPSGNLTTILLIASGVIIVSVVVGFVIVKKRS